MDPVYSYVINTAFVVEIVAMDPAVARYGDVVASVAKEPTDSVNPEAEITAAYCV